ncbi:MAG: transporter substrate-binding domain-containing protein [Spirochaetales bacterium]|nr:transporter substrate-binding domain-containing protein [Spirochaetales bacterium]
MKRTGLKLLLLLLSLAPLLPQELEKVRWGTEVWKGFTDKDGSGLYTRVLRRIFEEGEGWELEIFYYPFSRSLYLTEKGELDMAGGIPQNSELGRNCLQAQIPIVVSRFSAFYRKNNIENIEGVSSLRGKNIVCTLSVGEMIGLEPEEYYVVNTREQAINLVLIGRYDIYIDDEKVLHDTIEEYQSRFDREDYSTGTIATEGWYMIFPDNERGRRIRDMFDEGMRRLDRSGELETLYRSLGFIPPDTVP